MINRLPTPERPPSVANLRLVVTGLIIGLCIFGGAILFSASRIGGKIFVDPLIGYVLAAIAIIALFVQWRVIPPMIRKKKASATTASQLLTIYGQEIIFRAGLLEAAAVLQYVGYLLSMNNVTLATGIALVVAILFLRPTDESFHKWCGDS
jgi:hypothetical protein